MIIKVIAVLLAASVVAMLVLWIGDVARERAYRDIYGIGSPSQSGTLRVYDAESVDGSVIRTSCGDVKVSPTGDLSRVGCV